MWSSSATRPTAARISPAGIRRARSGEAMFSGDRLLRVQRVALEDHRQVARRGRDARGVEAVEVDAARVELLEPGDRAQRRRLPRPRRAEDDEERAVGDVERDPVERLHVAERLAQPLRADRAHQASTSSVSGS